MKLIFKVARTELRNLFYSPVAWFLTIAFLVQCAMFYTVTVEAMARVQEMMAKDTADWMGFSSPLTATIYLNQNGIFINVLQNLYLFVPLLTMGLISREINNGTIKLLYSSPLKTRHLVLGKYLAMTIYNLVLVAIVAIFVIMGCLNIQDADYGRLLSALLGFFLLVSAYTAIGIYMSSITTYQIVSAIATFTIIFALTYIGALWQKYDVVRDITYFLSMNGRAVKFLTGLITTNDVLYFLVIIVMFLGFTLFRLKGARQFMPRYKKTFRYVALSAVCLIIGYFASKPGMIGYWDVTRDNINTIHPRTQSIIANFDKNEPLEVTLYANLIGNGWLQGGRPEAKNDYRWRLWDQYLRFKPDIKFKYVYYYDIADHDSAKIKGFKGKDRKEIAQSIAKAFGADFSKCLPPAEMRKQIDLQKENMRLVMQVKYKGKTTFLRTFDDGPFWPGETEVSAAFLRLQADTMPKILFTSGNLERSVYKAGEREYFMGTRDIGQRNALVNVGFDVDSINLDEKDIPAGISSLVIADPKTTLSLVKQEKIRNYIASGGNAYILTEPGKSEIINPLLTETGAQFLPGTCVEVSKDHMADRVVTVSTPASQKLVPFDSIVLRNGKVSIPARPFYYPLAGVTAIKQATSSPFGYFDLLKTRSESNGWMKMGRLVTDSAAPVFSPQEGDYKDSSFVLMRALYRNVNNKEQRILLSGDADVFSTLRQGGQALLHPTYSWLDYNRLPNFAARPTPLDLFLSISPEAANMQVYVFLYILPAILLVLSIILLVRRKRK